MMTKHINLVTCGLVELRPCQQHLYPVMHCVYVIVMYTTPVVPPIETVEMHIRMKEELL